MQLGCEHAPADPEAPLAGRTSVLWGGLLEVVLAAAVVGTAVALYPLVRRHAPRLAVAYVALRTLEASVILTGVVILLPAVAGPSSALAPGLSPDVVAALQLVHDWTFLVGPGLVAPINTGVIAWLLLRHDLVLRAIPILGLVGAPLVAAANLGVMFGQGRQALSSEKTETSSAVDAIRRLREGIGARNVRTVGRAATSGRPHVALSPGHRC